MILSLILLFTFSMRSSLFAESRVAKTGGNAYEQSTQCAAIGPGLLLAGGILALMIGVAITASTEHAHS